MDLLIADARDPDRIRPGAMLLAGNPQGRAVVRVVAVDDDGQIHFSILPGSIEKNATSSAGRSRDVPLDAPASRRT